MSPFDPKVPSKALRIGANRLLQVGLSFFSLVVHGCLMGTTSEIVGA
jgi:hypothetical protein